MNIVRTAPFKAINFSAFDTVRTAITKTFDVKENTVADEISLSLSGLGWHCSDYLLPNGRRPDEIGRPRWTQNIRKSFRAFGYCTKRKENRVR